MKIMINTAAQNIDLELKSKKPNKLLVVSV